MIEHAVIVGAGLGGVRTAEQLRNAGYQGSICLVGAEPHVPYDRPPLSKQVLTGEWRPERVVLRDADGLASLNVRSYLGDPAVALRDGKVELADGTVLDADAVVVATGAGARKLPGQPAEVHSLRSLDDALALRAALDGARSLLVVGGGFIGAEVASSARARGIAVTVLEALSVPCERALGSEVGTLCGRLLAESGVDLRAGVQLEGFLDANTVELAGGERISADVVLVGVGAAPEVGWLVDDDDALDTADGLACDASGRVVGASGVWAVGDVAAWADPAGGGRLRREHWTNVIDQAAVVARDIVGVEPPPPSLPYFWSDQFGLKIQMVGWPERADAALPLLGDGLSGGAVKGTVVGFLADDHLVAVVGFGAARHVARYRALIARGADRAEAAELAG